MKLMQFYPFFSPYFLRFFPKRIVMWSHETPTKCTFNTHKKIVIAFIWKKAKN